MTAKPQQLQLLGTLLGNYRVMAQLGEGGMGVVYLGRHETLGHRVAVKVLQRELSSNDDMVQRFFNEAQAAAAIRNLGIVQVFDFGTTPDGRAYFVMELLEGQSLAARMKQRRIGYAECCRIGRQIANVLQAAHARGITHRDLKPENLFLVADAEAMGGERVKVLDFGIAKLAGDVNTSGVKTRTGLIMGTPIYMSPEQCRGAGTVDARTDIYALGCILFQMVCRRPPFLGEGDGEIIGAHLHLEPPRPQSLVPDAPPRLSALISNMLAKSPGARPQTMAEVSQALDDIMQALGAPARTATADPSPLLPAPVPPSGRAPVPVLGPPPLTAILEGGSTTLGDAAGVTDVRTKLQQTQPYRLPLVLGGAAALVALVAIIIAIAIAVGGSDEAEQQRSEETTLREPTGSGGAPATEVPAAAPSPPQSPGAAAGSSLLEQECLRYQTELRWAELNGCADRLQVINPKLASEYKDRAALETKAASMVEAMEEALQERELKRAKAQLDRIPSEADRYMELRWKYDMAEKEAIQELIAKLDRVNNGDCKEYERLLQQERGAKPARVANEAAKVVKCSAGPQPTKSPGACDHKALDDKGRENFAAGQYAAAMELFGKAFNCKPDPVLLERALSAACNMPNASKARSFWKRLTPTGKQRTLGICVRNGITAEMLDAP